ncbi:MAG: hypothetical protein WCM76_16070 [Bacteroidota bacterium]
MNEQLLEKIYLKMCKHFNVEFIPEHFLPYELKKIETVFNHWVEKYNKLGAEKDERVIYYRPNTFGSALPYIIGCLMGAQGFHNKWYEEGYLEYVERYHPAFYNEGLNIYNGLIEQHNNDTADIVYKKFEAFDSSEFYEGLKEYHQRQGGETKKIFDHITDKLKYEQITDKDILLINPTTVVYKSYMIKDRVEQLVKIYIISSKYIVCLTFGKDGLANRTEHIIKRDIKKLELERDLDLYIHYHGLHDPQKIVLENYEEAIDLQRFLTQNRENSNQGSGHQNQRK